MVYSLSYLPWEEYPSCLHTTCASLSSQLSSQTVPHRLLKHTSTLPSRALGPPANLKSPSKLQAVVVVVFSSAEGSIYMILFIAMTTKCVHLHCTGIVFQYICTQCSGTWWWLNHAESKDQLHKFEHQPVQYCKLAFVFSLQHRYDYTHLVQYLELPLQAEAELSTSFCAYWLDGLAHTMYQRTKLIIKKFTPVRGLYKIRGVGGATYAHELTPVPICSCKMDCFLIEHNPLGV